MVPDRMTDIRKRLQCAAGPLNAVLAMTETDPSCEQVLHQSHALEASFQIVGQKLILYQIEEIETLITKSQSPEECTAQFRRLVPLYSMAQRYSYVPSDKDSD